MADENSRLLPTKEEEATIQEDPRQLGRHRWRVFVLVTIFSFLSPLTNSTYLPELKDIQNDFNTSKTLVSWTLASYSLGISIFPLLWGPISDRLSRKYVLATTLLLYTATTLLAGKASDISCGPNM